MTKTTKKTVVVGAGVIGAAIAWELQKRGREVTLVDRDEPGRGASFGNMASIAVTEFMPVARPAIWSQIPGWLLDPEGPIRISPSHMLKLTPWFLRFMAASLPKRVLALERQGAALCQRALQDTQNLLQDLELSDDLSSSGCLSLYANEDEFAADRERIAMLDRYGFDYEVIGENALRELEPEITSSITKALLLPDNRTVRDPYRIVSRLLELFQLGGGQVIKASVTGFRRGAAIESLELNNGAVLNVDEVVICAGAYTGQLSKMLGDVIPLETERGYSTQIMDAQVELNHSIIWPAKAFMVSPTAGGIRVGGTVEMAGLDAAPNYARAKVTVGRAKMALPNLNVNDTTEWMGHRPALPDTVPVISASSCTHGVYYATGHGHLGLTNAATTALLMGQLMNDENTAIDLHPYRVNRF